MTIGLETFCAAVSLQESSFLTTKGVVKFGQVPL